MKIWSGLLLACVTALACTGIWADGGKVNALGGTVSVIRASAAPVALHTGDAVNIGDTVTTAANSWVVLSMEDGASVSLRQNAKLRVDAYHYDPDTPQQGKSWFSLLQGAMRSVTGAIGHLNPGSYRLNTPTATIGIRGTDYDAVVVTDDTNPDMPAGTYHTVHAGGTVFEGANGKVDVSPRQNVWLGGRGTGKPEPMQARQLGVWSRLQQFDRRVHLNNVLQRLHQRSGDGFTLNPARLDRGRERVEARMQHVSQDREERRQKLREEHKQHAGQPHHDFVGGVKQWAHRNGGHGPEEHPHRRGKHGEGIHGGGPGQGRGGGND
ncbi:FecR family protein [Andreprevotia chitinilytica]|uniref:FecR family protein n=1 Tax=Andreprevotia chitinilytica TaxID=396808 RepID=UPI00055431C8|nr:FecR domain-containing protein [Andreprevotia chitinilytica]